MGSFPRAPHTEHPIPVRKERFESWKEIAGYLNRDTSTVRRWERKKGLPVHRVPGGQRDTIYALRSEIDEWWSGVALQVGPVEPRRSRRAAVRRAALVGAACAVAVLMALAARKLLWPPQPSGVMRVARFTTYPGDEQFPAFSPDGRYVAFSWTGEQGGNTDIYIKHANGQGAAVRLTTHPALDMMPVFSPDGSQIVFMRWVLGNPQADVLLIPLFGGAERKIGDTFFPIRPPLPFPLAVWTSGGKALIWARAPAPGKALRLVQTRLDTGETRELLAPPRDPGDCCPALSPGGRSLVFARAAAGEFMSLYVLGLNAEGLPEGSPRKLISEPGGAWNPLWTADGREVLYLSLRDGALGLWRTPVSGGAEARPVTSIGPIGRHLAISHRDNRLIYSTLSLDEDIWAVQTRAAGAPVRLIASSLTDSAPQMSPDGAKIAFISDRSGQTAVWVADPDGRNAAKLVDAPDMSAKPWWSPDSREIAYECSFGESSDICVIPANGGGSRRLTKQAGRHLYPSWSQDGRFIYFSSDRGGDFQVWKAPATGEGAAVQVTQSGGFAGFESPDGRYVYYTKTPQSGQVWRTPVGGGDERPVAGMVRSLRRPQNFAVGAGGIYYAVSEDPRARFQILFRRFGSDKPVTLARVERALGAGMSLTPDGRTLLFSAFESRGGDLMLVENFR